MPLNLFSDLGAIAQTIQDDAIFVVRESYIMPQAGMVKIFNDLQSANTRTGYTYNQGTAGTIAEADDLASQSFVPTADQTLTPYEIGLQFFISDKRADSSGNVPESVLNDAATELGNAAGDKVQADLLNDFSSLTGGTVGVAGSVITWSYVAAQIAAARQANKSSNVPLVYVMHGYQWAKLAASASIAGATVAVAPGVQDEITRTGYLARYMGVDLYQVYPGTEVCKGTGGTAWMYTGCYNPAQAIALDWRRSIRIEAQRDASRRGVELNMTALYAHGAWRPARGAQGLFLATLPTL